MRGRASGTLRLSASVTFGQTRIVPLLSAFRARHPDVRLECVFTDTNLDLVAHRIDLAIRLAPTVAGDMIVTKLADTRYRVVASPAYLAAAPRLREPADLAAHRALLFPFPRLPHALAFPRRGRRRRRAARRGRSGDGAATALIGAACDGLGPRSPAELGDRPRARRRPPDRLLPGLGRDGDDVRHRGMADLSEPGPFSLPRCAP